jgi:hypothetical protein
MPPVLTTNSTVLCGHGGKVLVQGSPKLTVSGASVLVAAGIIQPVDTVTQPCSIKPPPNTNVPCTSVLSVDPSSLSKKLILSGSPVAIVPLTGTTNGSLAGTTPQKLLTATANQAKLNTV